MLAELEEPRVDTGKELELARTLAALPVDGAELIEPEAQALLDGPRQAHDVHVIVGVQHTAVRHHAATVARGRHDAPPAARAHEVAHYGRRACAAPVVTLAAVDRGHVARGRCESPKRCACPEWPALAGGAAYPWGGEAPNASVRVRARCRGPPQRCVALRRHRRRHRSDQRAHRVHRREEQR